MPSSEQARVDRIQAALDASPTETLRVKFRGQMRAMPVIQLPLTDAVLNHRSHRIRSQVESSPHRDAIRDDPESDEAQDAIRQILRETPGFQALKQNVGDETQREPGVVTRNGLLVNANTRAVALFDLGKQYIDVAVLPSDTSIEEIYFLEADLQVAEDYKQEYSYTNELLFVQDLLTEQSLSEEDVAIQMRWASPGNATSIRRGAEQVRSYGAQLSVIREIQALSGGKVPLTAFDDSRQTLLEFDARYQQQVGKDPEGAAKMKQATMLALLVELGYQASRAIQPDWVDGHLADALRENELLGEHFDALAGGSATDTATEPEGLGVLDELEEDHHGGGSVGAVVEQLVTRLSRSGEDGVVKLPSADGGEQEYPTDAVKDAVQDAMKSAAETAAEATKAGDVLKAPITFCEDAAKKLKKALDAYKAASGDADFDTDKFKAAFEKAERALDAVRTEAAL